MYDRMTVGSARRNIVHYYDFYTKLENKLPKGDKISRPGNAILLNVFYMQTLGNELIRRYQERDQRIEQWMMNDEAEDEQIASARLTVEPYCQHCQKQGLRITDKSLMHRKEKYDIDDPEEVLFMLKCPHCNKISVFWEDGTAWESKPTLCPKCSAEMTNKTARTKQAITFTYSCPSCNHSYKDKMDLTDKEEKPDPNYEKDRIHYCLLDQEFREKLIEIKRGLEEMAKLGKEFKEKEDNKDLYAAVEELKKPKLAELNTLLSPSLEKVGYIDFGFDKPEIGKDFIVSFNCLDNKPERSDYDSQKTLKKTIEKALTDTNWRLMSEGISYRLGYLNGRLRAYERDEDLLNLVMKSKNFKHKKEQSLKEDIEKNQYTIKDKDGNDINL